MLQTGQNLLGEALHASGSCAQAIASAGSNGGAVAKALASAYASGVHRPTLSRAFASGLRPADCRHHKCHWVQLMLTGLPGSMPG